MKIWQRLQLLIQLNDVAFANQLIVVFIFLIHPYVFAYACRNVAKFDQK